MVQSKDDIEQEKSGKDPSKQSKPRTWMSFWKVHTPQPHTDEQLSECCSLHVYITCYASNDAASLCQEKLK